MAGKIVFLVVLLVGTCLSRNVQNRRSKEQKTRKYSVAYPQPVAVQGVTNYGCGGSPCASHGTYQSPSYPATCCPTGDSSCCGSSQSPPCCLTIQPYESKNITVDAPSKVMLQINVLPIPANITAPTTAPTSGSTAGSTPGSTAGSTPGSNLTTPSPPPPPPGQSPTLKDLTVGNNMQAFRAEALAESNKERAVHFASGLSDLPNNGLGSALVLDAGLNIAAQRYAQKIAAEKRPAHSDPISRMNQGENIAVACSAIDKPLSGKTAANMWYDEVKKYDWNMPGYNAKTGHFTQAVWKGSKRVGFGRSKYINEKGKSCYVVVARYTPRGNIKGKFPQNVSKGNYQQI